jgi:hypothetical protein
VTAYNHNIDTLEEYYPEIVSTHSYSDRLNTIRAVQQANLSVCCGGIVGTGETELDRLKMLGGIDQFRSAAGERADQLLDANAGHTPRGPTAGRDFRVGSSDCNGSNCLTEGQSPSVRWAHPAFKRGTGPLFVRRGKLHFLREQTFDGREPWGRSRSRTAERA